MWPVIPYLKCISPRSLLGNTVVFRTLGALDSPLSDDMHRSCMVSKSYLLIVHARESFMSLKLVSLRLFLTLWSGGKFNLVVYSFK